MKLVRTLLASGIAAALVGVATTGPAAAKFFTYSTGVQIQNLEATTASVQLNYYNASSAGGGLAGSFSDTINGNTSKTYFPLSGVSDGFNGSAVVSSDRQVAAIVNVVDKNGKAGASYIGFSTGGTSMFVPLLFNNYFGNNSWFKVQNAGSGGNANVTVTYSDGVVKNASIQPGAAAEFDQTTEGHAAGTVFAARITSDQPIVASVIQESSSVMFAYNGFANGSTAPVMPLVNANYYGNITGMQIQNSGASSTNVTVSYSPSLAGAACTETQTIPAGASRTFALYAFSVAGSTSSTCAFGAAFVGSARVTTNSASQPLAVIVNQLNNSAPNGEAYSGFDPNAATNTVVMPLIMDRYYGFFTGFSVMSLGASPTNVNCTFSGTSYTVNQNLNQYQSMTPLQQNAIAPGYVGAGTCVASGAGAKIVGVVNEVNANAVGTDQLFTYEAINK